MRCVRSIVRDKEHVPPIFVKIVNLFERALCEISCRIDTVLPLQDRFASVFNLSVVKRSSFGVVFALVR